MQKLFFLSLTFLLILNIFAQPSNAINPDNVTIVRDSFGVPHIFGKKCMRSDYDVDFAVGEPCLDFTDLSGRTKTADIIDAYGIIGKSFAEAAVMLKRKNCRRAENCDLFTRHRRLKRRANCNFGLSEANVAAHEPVHGFF